MAATEDVGIVEGSKKDGKKQEEGDKKVVAELGVLFGPKGGWVGMPGKQLGWHKRRGGWAGHIPQHRGPLHTARPAHCSCCRKARSPRCHSLGLSR